MVRILHLSDTHVSENGCDEDGVDAVGSLRRMLHDARHVPDLDLVVVSGDIADDGSVAGCRTVRQMVGAYAASRGVPHVYSTGNHDSRGAFVDALGSGHIGASGNDVASARGPGCAAASEVHGLRVVTLDSLVLGRGHGVLGGDQLTWLRDLLTDPTPEGTVLIFHHPPIRLGAITYSRQVGLQDADALADVVRGTDVRAVLTGHLHLQASGFLAGVPVWVTPGVVTRMDATSPPRLARAVLGASATVVDLDGPFAPTFHVLHARDPRNGSEVYVYDPLTGEDEPE